jgi:hypothetical protein
MLARGRTAGVGPKSVCAFVMGDRARPFEILHFRSHGPLAFPLLLHADVSTMTAVGEKAERNKMARFHYLLLGQHLGYLI